MIAYLDTIVQGGVMKPILKTGLSMLLFWMLCTADNAPVHAGSRYITIGTGGITGVYYLVGGAIARFVNKQGKRYDLRASAESTGGSVYNLNAVLSDTLQFGIVQSDLQFQAWKGIKRWQDKGPQKDLRSVCGFHSETVLLVAAEDAGIRKLEDLRGHPVNIGNPGSGQWGNAVDILTSCVADWKTTIDAREYAADEQAKALLEKQIDAFFYTVGHPNASVKQATSTRRKAGFVPLAGSCIDSMIGRCCYYTKEKIPIAYYPTVTNKTVVPTIAVKATLCTSADIPDDVVYAVTKVIFSNLENFRQLHPAFAEFNPENMLQTLSAPIHAGAMKYYKEAGLK